jgi:AraC-like DNA-binding protein
MTMLAEHDRSILDTATAVGFETLSGFDRAFRRLTGERPGDYRRRIRDTAMRDAPTVVDQDGAPTIR